jgi:hypothetical protein
MQIQLKQLAALSIYYKHLYMYYCRPIPCGPAGTYAHYGLFNGLLGISIGSLYKDVRFYLDNLVDKFSSMFEATILDKDSNMTVVTSKFSKFEKDMLKWRWKQIRNDHGFGELIIITIGLIHFYPHTCYYSVIQTCYFLLNRNFRLILFLNSVLILYF